MHPLDIPTSQTLPFILAHLSRSPARILEVGAGDGRLARALLNLHHSVLALDSNPESVALCKSRGIDARLADWPAFTPDNAEQPFDAILFTRSLHHINPLDAAIAHALSLLSPPPHAGRIIIEDFSFSDLDEPTTSHLLAELRALAAAGLLDTTASPESFPAELLASSNPRAVVERHHHRHHLHAADAIRAALARAATLIHESTAPYLYRYLAAAAHPTPRAAAAVERALLNEQRAIASGAIRPLGRRLVAVSG